MKGLFLGFFIIFGSIYLVLSKMDTHMFFNMDAILLVLGGTLGVFFYATPFSALSTIARILKALVKPELTSKVVGGQLLQLSHNKAAKFDRPHPVIAYAQELWEKGVDTEMFQALLMKYAHEQNSLNMRVIIALRNLGKYPPTLGMLGTVVGLIEMFAKLSTSSKAALGPSLSVSMVCTLYGLGLANFIVLPISDRIQVYQMAEAETSQFICKILLMIEQDHGESLIKDEIHVAV
ncbi:MAG: MotA/TolQ/ExbB proton channel family protein [bacterium]